MYKCLAAIDIGSNTVHLIVVATDGRHLTILADDSIFVRLADGVWNLGYIPEERIIATCQALLHLRGIAQSFGAEAIAVVATEVARTARNTSALLSAVHAATGLRPLVLSGMDEAMLTFRGVTYGQHLPTNVAVADLGGGSLEIIIAELGHGSWRTSLPVGSAFMHDRFASHDPLREDEITALQQYLAETFTTIPRLSHVDELQVCGGTVNALMRVVQQQQGRASGDHILRQTDLESALAVMQTHTSSQIAHRFHLRFERARLLPTGAVILSSLLERLGLPGILVSQAGIREGVIQAMAVHGDEWLEGARADAYKWRTIDMPIPTSSPTTKDVVAIGQQPSYRVAWNMMHEQSDIMLTYCDTALEGDVEAVHDMRVASRRLRTMLDIFSPCFPVNAVRRLRKAVKVMAQALGDVRDADVALESLHQQLTDTDPKFELALRQLIRERKDERRNARRSLRRQLRPNEIARIRSLVLLLQMTDDILIPITAIRGEQVQEPVLEREGTV